MPALRRDRRADRPAPATSRSRPLEIAPGAASAPSDGPTSAIISGSSAPPRRTVVRGSGMFVPDGVVTNERMSRLMDTTDEWIRQRTGHRGAALRAHGDVLRPTSASRPRGGRSRTPGSRPGDIDLIVFATMTPAHYFPGNGGLLARAARPRSTTHALDIRMQCAGFLSGPPGRRRVHPVGHLPARAPRRRGVPRVALSLDRGGVGGHVRRLRRARLARGLRLGHRAARPRGHLRRRRRAPSCSRRTTRTTAAASSASRCGPTARTGTSSTCRAAAPRRFPYFSPEMFEDNRTIPIVEGRQVFRLATTAMPADRPRDARRSTALSLEDLSLLLMHQANLRINEAVQKSLGLPDEKVFNNIQRYGNTTAATLPLVFHEAKQAGRIRDGRPRLLHRARRRAPLGRGAPARLIPRVTAPELKAVQRAAGRSPARYTPARTEAETDHDIAPLASPGSPPPRLLGAAALSAQETRSRGPGRARAAAAARRDGSSIFPSTDVPRPGTLSMLFTHRFSQALEDSDIHSLYSFDSGADIGIGLAYAPVTNLDICALPLVEPGRPTRSTRSTSSRRAVRAGVAGGRRLEDGASDSEPQQLLRAGDRRVSIGSRVRITAVPTYVSRVRRGAPSSPRSRSTRTSTTCRRRSRSP